MFDLAHPENQICHPERSEGPMYFLWPRADTQVLRCAQDDKP